MRKYSVSKKDETYQRNYDAKGSRQPKRALLAGFRDHFHVRALPIGVGWVYSDQLMPHAADPKTSISYFSPQPNASLEPQFALPFVLRIIADRVQVFFSPARVTVYKHSKLSKFRMLGVGHNDAVFSVE